ncbi:MAG: IS1634 family transposase [Bryobacteraceae bacterium]
MLYSVGMYIARARWPSSNGKVYESIYLRESYRDGPHVRKRNLANLTHCDRREVEALHLALKHKGNLAALGSLDQIELSQGPSVGALWTVYETARRLGLPRALGPGFAGQLALWQVLARVREQGSRLSAVRLAQVHAAGDVLGLERGFDENDLYTNLTWLSEHQPGIEDRLFATRRAQRKPQLFLYDVTSSYLEGEKNAYGAYGYNRDGKRGKQQIVIGLLCDEQGEPVSTEVVRGNTQDPKTFAAQVKKASERFGCEGVTFVGDRGMIKSGQVEDLARVGFHYITAITKPQIETLLGAGVLQMELFGTAVCEVEQDGVRYVLRRNPLRAEQLAASRADKQARVEKLQQERNGYLAEHPRAKVTTAEKAVRAKIAQLKIDAWLGVEAEGRSLKLTLNPAARQEVSRLDGCYVLKTDLPPRAASKQVVHDRYKDLAEVEQAFRTCKTTHLETRPIYVRTAEHTRGHVLVVMLAYLIRRELSRAWAPLDVTVEEGLHQLQTLCSTEMKVKGGGSCLRIPRPCGGARALLQAVGLHLPDALPHREIAVDTRKKLPERRKPR